jgi:hypothetical protein
MDTLFDPDDLIGRARPEARPHAPPDTRPHAPPDMRPDARPTAPAEAAGGSVDTDRTGASASPMPAIGTSGGGPTLDDLVAGVWEGLAAHRVVECPVCASDMRPEYGVHALPIGGRCGACGSTLG